MGSLRGGAKKNGKGRRATGSWSTAGRDLETLVICDLLC